jgi:predicted RNA-binding protein YlxR (DUF448 family)
VTVAAHIAMNEDELRERRCIVTGEALPESKLIRFVADPDGEIVPDVAAVLPGRGIWVSASRNLLERAIAKNHFARAAKANVRAPTELVARTEAQLVSRRAGELGMAPPSNLIALGFDNVVRALEGAVAPAALVEASDGAADGRRKLAGIVKSRGLELDVISVLSSAEMSLALGRENVIHAALKPGRLAERLIFQAGRLEGIRTAGQPQGPAGSTPVAEKGNE